VHTLELSRCVDCYTFHPNHELNMCSQGHMLCPGCNCSCSVEVEEFSPRGLAQTISAIWPQVHLEAHKANAVSADL
jgi:hypothetical protein